MSHYSAPAETKVPTGGATGQALVKRTATSHDLTWQTLTAQSDGVTLTAPNGAKFKLTISNIGAVTVVAL